MESIICRLERAIGYSFKDRQLPQTALTHSSYAYEHHVKSNERLEFLGDSVLNFIVAEYLFKKGLKEGDMSVARSKIVSRTPLALAVEQLAVLDLMQLGSGAAKSERFSAKFKSNLYESIVGAIFVDSGSMDECRNFIYRTLDFNYDSSVDYKSSLQEYVQAKKMGAIIYKDCLTDSCTPIFRAEVFVGGKKVGEGFGGTKKDAQKKAAKAALRVFNALPHEN